MTITITLSEALDKCRDWGDFCAEFGWSEWCVNEGGGHITQSLTEEEAIKHGIIKR
jgi:hypothetical protein